uniref:TOX high mobility group box family member 4-A-like isoform X3 n=1 Tax=Myxine glutinosa TaxID=7769 RepID=UPI00359005D8
MNYVPWEAILLSYDPGESSLAQPLCLQQAIVTNAGTLRPIVSLGPAEPLAVSSATRLTTTPVANLLGSDLSTQTRERRLRPISESVGGPGVTLIPTNVPVLSQRAPAEMPAANLQAVRVEEGEQGQLEWQEKAAPLEPQRPVSAYALFFRDTQAAIKGQNAHVTFGDVSRIVASMWESLAVEQKQVYKDKTEVAKKEYFKALAAFRASQESDRLINSPQQPHPTTSLQQLHPTASPQQPCPTASPQQPCPTASPQQPCPTASPQQPCPTASPQQPCPTTSPQQLRPPSPHLFSLPHAHTPIILLSSQSRTSWGSAGVSSADTSHHAVANTSPASCPAQALVMTGGSAGLSREHPSMSVQGTNPEDPIREPGNPNEPGASVMDYGMESEEATSLFEEIETLEFEEQSGEKVDQEEEVEDQTPAAQTSPVRSSTTDNRCQRAGCDRLAVTSSEWDEEYCSCECVVAHCSAVFAAWVEERMKASHRLEQPA